MPRKKYSRSRPRFLKALLLAFVASFGTVSYVLHAHDGGLPTFAQQIVGFLDDTSKTTPRAPNTAAPNAAFTPMPERATNSATVPTRFTQCPQFFPHGYPPAITSAAPLRDVCFSAFAVLYNGQTKTPLFVVERLNRRLLIQGQGLPRTDKFYAEARLPRAEQADLNDYRGSGFSRGHMAPAADMPTAEAMAQSFSLANMVPQDKVHNAGAWNDIEKDTRRYIMRAAGDVYVFTGPVYSAQPKVIGKGVAVPSYLFKLVYDASTQNAWVYWQANRSDTKVSSPISYAEFVKRTGLDLLAAPR